MEGDPTDAATDPDQPPDEQVTGPRYDDWPIADEGHENAQYLGATVGGVPYYHDRDTVFRGEPDEENREIVADRDSRRELGADDTLGDVLAEIGDSIGWDSLSEFARDHLSEEDGGRETERTTRE